MLLLELLLCWQKIPHNNILHNLWLIGSNTPSSDLLIESYPVYWKKLDQAIKDLIDMLIHRNACKHTCMIINIF